MDKVKKVKKEETKMSRAEYIIWKCDTLDDIKEQHPEWNEQQINAYFRAIEEMANITIMDDDMVRTESGFVKMPAQQANSWINQRFMRVV